MGSRRRKLGVLWLWSEIILLVSVMQTKRASRTVPKSHRSVSLLWIHDQVSPQRRNDVLKPTRNLWWWTDSCNVLWKCHCETVRTFAEVLFALPSNRVIIQIYKYRLVLFENCLRGIWEHLITTYGLAMKLGEFRKYYLLYPMCFKEQGLDDHSPSSSADVYSIWKFTSLIPLNKLPLKSCS